MYRLYLGLCALSVYRFVLCEPAVESLTALLGALGAPDAKPERLLSLYADVCRHVLSKGFSGPGELILDAMRYQASPYADAAASGARALF
jgi:hypothetical protein